MKPMSDSQRGKLFKTASLQGLDNDMLHDYVYNLTGKTSIKLLTFKDANKVIDALVGKKQNADNMITKPQRRFIEGLAKEVGMVNEKNELDPEKLRDFIEKRFHISDITWLTAKKASDVIQGLRAMNNRGKKAI